MSIEIKPGSKLDRAVAEAIGDPYPRAHDWEATGQADYECNVFRCKNCGDLALEDSPPSVDPNDPCVKLFSTDLNAAFAAAEKVGLFAGACGLFRDTPTRWSACDQDYIRGVGNTPALAICAAILNLKEME